MVNHLITEPVKLTACPRCGEYAITGFSAGMLVKTSLQPLSVHQEIAALLAGRKTFDLIAFGIHFYLEKRSADRMKGERVHVVVATHTCQPAIVPLKPGPDLKLRTIPAVPLPDDPPF